MLNMIKKFSEDNHISIHMFIRCFIFGLFVENGWYGAACGIALYQIMYFFVKVIGCFVTLTMILKEQEKNN